MQSITELKAEIKRLKDENEYMRVRFKEVDRICGKLILTMQCAVIDSEHGKGDKAAVNWIYDALLGLGELPPDGETNAQEYADRNLLIGSVRFQQSRAGVIKKRSYFWFHFI